MPEFKEVKQETRKFGENGYVEVTRKRVIEEGVATQEFIVVSRGFFERDGATKRWTKFVTLPDDVELRAWVAEVIRSI